MICISINDIYINCKQDCIWLKLRDFAVKLRNRFTKVGTDQFKQKYSSQKILVQIN